MSAVNISGTFKKDRRPDNGLEAIANDLVKNEFARYTVVGIVELHKVVKEPGEEPRPTVHFVALEVLDGDAADVAQTYLNDARRDRDQGPLSGTLFDSDPDRDGEAGESEGDGELPGQGTLVDPFNPPAPES